MVFLTIEKRESKNDREETTAIMFILSTRENRGQGSRLEISFKREININIKPINIPLNGHVQQCSDCRNAKLFPLIKDPGNTGEWKRS